MISYFKRKPVTSSLEARLSTSKIHAMKLHDEWLSRYVEVVSSSLTTHAIENIIIHAVNGPDPFKHALGLSVTLYAKRVYTKALLCVVNYDKKRVYLLVVEILDESFCDNTRAYLEQQFHVPLTELAFSANTLIKIANKSVQTSQTANDTPSQSAVESNRSYVFAVELSVDKSHKIILYILSRTLDRFHSNRRQLSLLLSKYKIL